MQRKKFDFKRGTFKSNISGPTPDLERREDQEWKKGEAWLGNFQKANDVVR